MKHLILLFTLMLSLSSCKNPLGNGKTGSETDSNFQPGLQAGNVSSANSTIVVSAGTPVADGASTATVTITLLDADSLPVSGIVPTFSATDTGSTNSYSACSASDGSGVSTCNFTSTKAETKTVAMVSPVSVTGNTITFVHGVASQVAFTTQPSGAVAGVIFTTQPTVKIQDAYGNTVITGTDSSATVTMTLTTGTGSLTGTVSVMAVMGVAVWTDLKIDAMGAKVITATKADLSGSGGTVSSAVASSSFTNAANPPSAPTGLAANTGNGAVAMSWTASAGATSYNIMRGTVSGSLSQIATSATNSYTDTTPTNGTTYYYAVQVVTIAGTSANSSEISARPIGAFTISSVSVNAAGSFLVTWASATGATNYAVNYSTSSGGPYSSSGCTSVGTSCSVASLTAGTTYYFMVTATNSVGGGASVNATAQSSGVPLGSFTISSATPDATNGTTGTVALAFGASTGASAYTVKYGTATGVYGTTASTSATSPYTVTGLSAGTTYYFMVVATNANGSLNATAEISQAPYRTFALDIPYTTGTDASYSISDTNKVELASNVARLKASSQIDSDNSASGFGAATLTGTQWDATNSYLRLNTTTNNAELDSSWTPQWSNLVAYWKFDETSGTTVYDSVTAGHNGTISGSYTLGSSGKIKNAFTMNAGSNVTIGDYFDFTGNVQYSISLWFKTNVGTGAFDNLITKRVNSGGWSGWVLYVYGTPGTVTFSRDNAGQNQTVSLRQYNDGSWHNIIVTYDGANISIYGDGTLDRTVANATVIPDTAASLQITSGLNGSMRDDVAFWSTALTASEVATIYSRQSAKYSGLAQSRVMDAYVTGQPWQSLAATTTLPFSKEQPGNSGGESSANYSSLYTTTSLNSNLAGLWKFDSSSYNGSANEVVDSSGNNAHGTTVGTPTVVSGNLSKSIFFNGGQYVSIPNANISTDISNTVSTCFWMKTTDPLGTYSWATLVGKLGTSGWTTSRRISTKKMHIRIDTSAQTNQQWVTTADVFDGLLHQVCLSIDNGNLTSWIDGKSDVGGAYLHGTGIGNTSDMRIASGAGGASDFRGSVDEVALWNRVLSNTEVTQLYRRGANRIKYQVRTCTASDCSDQEAITAGKGWKGPDNTFGSYFSELHNNTSINASGDPAGNVNISPLSLAFSSFSGAGLSVSTNRYFQYRAILESDDQNTLCNYGSGATSCSPELKSVSIGPDHYDTTVQTVTSSSGIGSAYQSIDTNGFTATLGASCSAVAKYSVSRDGTQYYYWNGAAWTLSSDTYATASTATDMSTNISTFPSAIGTGTLQLKTFLKSDGTSPCEVDNLQITGKKL